MHYGEDTVGGGNYAPVTGRVVFAGWDSTGHGFGWCIGIQETGTSVIWWMAHHGTTSAVNPLRVTVGQQVAEGTYLGPLGATGAATGPHVHTERRVGGTARPGTGAATDPRAHYSSTAGGGTTPFPTTRRRKNMLHFYIDDPKSARGVKYILLTEEGYTIEYTSGSTDFPNGIASQVGNAIKTDQALIDALKAQVKAQRPTSTVGDVSVDLAPLVAELRALGAKLDALGVKVDALPPEIDRYADGRKQAP